MHAFSVYYLQPSSSFIFVSIQKNVLGWPDMPVGDVTSLHCTVMSFIAG